MERLGKPRHRRAGRRPSKREANESISRYFLGIVRDVSASLDTTTKAHTATAAVMSVFAPRSREGGAIDGEDTVLRCACDRFGNLMRWIYRLSQTSPLH